MSSCCSPKGRHGDTCRVSEGGLGAIQTALLRAGSGGLTPVFTPHVGADFDSAEEAYEFYNMYSWEIDFGIRYDRSYSNTCGYTTRLDIVCSCYVSFSYLQAAILM